jgi:hypothetical protein
MSVNVTHGSAVGTVHQEDKTVDQVVNVLKAKKEIFSQLDGPFMRRRVFTWKDLVCEPSP